jgi:hypothetical protein
LDDFNGFVYQSIAVKGFAFWDDLDSEVDGFGHGLDLRFEI